MSDKYLYGAAVQGIQSFIFQTNKLKEIIGASELVEQVCTTLFANLIFNKDYSPAEAGSLMEKQEDLNKKLFDAANTDCLMAAAGNIKYIMDVEQCKTVYRNFPRIAVLFAPGLTVSQAFVKLKESRPTQDEINELEGLLRSQRNKPTPPLETGWSIITRAPRTGLPAVDIYNRNGERRDEAMRKKQDAAKISNNLLLKKLVGDEYIRAEQVPFDMEELTTRSGKSWIAVVHADGNNLGKIISGLAANNANDAGTVFREFSRKLDNATQLAAQKAFKETFVSNDEIGEKGGETKKIGIRPIVIGGDDFTFVCRADKAIDFTRLFLEYFEQETEANFNAMTRGLPVKKLTACAGIAFIKKNYPLHYGLELAETLCSEAKKASKKQIEGQNHADVPASLAFHKVQDSFLTEWKQIKAREMVFGNGEKDGRSVIDFDYGPYAISTGNANGQVLNSLDELLKIKSLLEEENAPKSGLRQWLTELSYDYMGGAARMDRLIMVLEQTKRKQYIDSFDLTNFNSYKISGEKDKYKKSPLYQALMLTSLNE